MKLKTGMERGKIELEAERGCTISTHGTLLVGFTKMDL
jgi:hypothetical protein